MKQKAIFTCALCILLCVCGCTARTAGEIQRTDKESQAETNAAGVAQEDSTKTPVEKEAANSGGNQNDHCSRTGGGLLACGCDSGSGADELLYRRCAGYGTVLGHSERKTAK